METQTETTAIENQVALRYNVGEKIFAVGFYHDGKKVSPSVWNSIGAVIGQQDLDWSVKIIELEVTEHHKVPWNQDPDENAEKKYDGFILKSTEGARFVNQWPRASYGQVSDFANRVFSIHFQKGDDLKEFLERYQVLRYVHISEIYESLKKAYSQYVIAHRLLSSIDTELREKYQMRMVEKPVWPEHPDITEWVPEKIN